MKPTKAQTKPIIIITETRARTAYTFFPSRRPSSALRWRFALNFAPQINRPRLSYPWAWAYPIVNVVKRTRRPFVGIARPQKPTSSKCETKKLRFGKKICCLRNFPARKEDMCPFIFLRLFDFLWEVLMFVSINNDMNFHIL